MNKLQTVLALLLLVDLGLWAGGSVSLWQAARRTVVLKRLLEEVAPGEVHQEPKLPMFARTPKLGDTVYKCAVPTKRWLLVPVLGPLMISKQHHIYAECLKAKLDSTTTLRARRTRSVRAFIYGMVLMVTLANVKMPIDIPEPRITTLLLRRTMG